MKHQKYYHSLQKQIILMIGLSLIPGLVYVFFGWAFHIALPAILWYGALVLISLYGAHLYRTFQNTKMDTSQLKRWYAHLTFFMYIIFSSWSVIFFFYVQHSEYNLHYIAIFTQLGATVVASTILVSDKKLFVPILLTMMLPLTIYFTLLGTWYGYVLAVFSLIFVAVLLYAAFNTNALLRKNYYQAQHDALTGLFNRRYFMEYIDDMVERLHKNKTVAYMMLIDLDHFKNINDSLGHDMGDKLLKEVANRIGDYAKEKYVFARLGGDEFILVSTEVEDSDESDASAHLFATNLLDKIREEYIVNQHHLHISASIGMHKLTHISVGNGHFIKEADIAMYEAKNRGRDDVMMFNSDLSKKVERHLVIEQKLHQTLSGHQLNVFYQPQFNKEAKIVGCEALVRWHDEELGILSPDEFIPIAENTGLILELGSYVLKEAFKVLHSWNEKNMYLETFSINVSIRQLLHEPFIEEVELLHHYYFSKLKEKQTIIFEITEHVFSEDMIHTVETMKRLGKLGISFSIDDFGTGYSSLSYLQELPIDEVKIDKVFIAGMNDKTENKNMVNTIISIAKNFNLSVVAEGVETEEQFKVLQSYDCNVFQGFYFDAALPAKSFERKYLITALPKYLNL